MFEKFKILRNEAGDGDGGGGSAAGDSGGSQSAGQQSSGQQGQSSRGTASNLVGDAGGQESGSSASTSGGQTAGETQGQDGSEGFSFTKLIGEDGQFQEGFAEALTKAHPDLAEGANILSRYKDPVSMAKALVHAQQLNSRKLSGVDDVLNVSPDDEKGMALKREKLGIPQSADGYNLKFPEKLEDGTEVNKDLVGSKEQLKEFAEFAHKNDIPEHIAQKLVEYDAERGTKAMSEAQAEAERQSEAQLAQDAEALRKELGSEYDRSMDLLVRLLESGGMTREQIATTQSLRDLDLTRALITLAKDSGDDRLPASSQRSGGLDAGAKAKDIIHNPNNPLHKGYWSGDEKANAEVQKYLKQEAAAKQQLKGGR